MSGETNLSTLLGSMSAHLVEGLFVFVTVPHDGRDPTVRAHAGGLGRWRHLRRVIEVLERAAVEDRDRPFDVRLLQAARLAIDPPTRPPDRDLAIDREQIITTLPKAKEIRSIADKLITLGKKGAKFRF